MAHNLNGSVLRITTRYDNRYIYDVEVEKIIYEHSSTEATYVLKGGFAITLIFELSRLLNFSYVLVPSVGAYEFCNATANEIDIFAGSYILNGDRAKIVDYTLVTAKSKVSAFMNHDFESSTGDIIRAPFEHNLWLAICSLAIILIISASVFAFFEHSNIRDTQFQCFALMTSKDSQFAIMSERIRVLMFISCLSFFVITTFYSGVVASIKSVNLYSIQSFDDLVNSDYGMFVEYGYNNGSTIQDIAEAVSGSTAMTTFLKKASKSELVFQNFQKMMQVVNNKPIAYVIDDETGISAVKLALGYFPCSWDRISFAGIQYPWTMYMKKQMPYKEAINEGLLKMDETGVLNVLRRRWIPHFETCPGGSGDYFAISLTQVYTTFIVLCTGVFLSGLIVIVEKYDSKKCGQETKISPDWKDRMYKGRQSLII